MDEIRNTAEKITDQLERIIFGKRDVLQMVLVCLLSEGHLLMEDVPGTAKTLLTKALSKALGGSFHQLQCKFEALFDSCSSSLYHFEIGQELKTEQIS